VGKYDKAGEATDDNIIWEMRFASWINMGIKTQNMLQELLFQEKYV
jgi:hypothetical protein